MKELSKELQRELQTIVTGISYHVGEEDLELNELLDLKSQSGDYNGRFMARELRLIRYALQEKIDSLKNQDKQ